MVLMAGADLGPQCLNKQSCTKLLTTPLLSEQCPLTETSCHRTQENSTVSVHKRVFYSNLESNSGQIKLSGITEVLKPTVQPSVYCCLGWRGGCLSTPSTTPPPLYPPLNQLKDKFIRNGHGMHPYFGRIFL